MTVNRTRHQYRTRRVERSGSDPPLLERTESMVKPRQQIQRRKTRRSSETRKPLLWFEAAFVTQRTSPAKPAKRSICCDVKRVGCIRISKSAKARMSLPSQTDCKSTRGASHWQAVQANAKRQVYHQATVFFANVETLFFMTPTTCFSV